MLRGMRKQASLAAIVVGSLAGFAVVANVARRARSSRFDLKAVQLIGRARYPATDAFMRGVTFFGSVPGGAIASLAGIALARKRPRAVLQIVLASVGGITAELIVKRFFRRKRPTLLDHLEDVTSTSFPSGHSMAAASIYLTLAFVNGGRPRDLAIASAVAGSIATSRVYLGVHWPTDVIAGLVLGTAWAAGAEALLGASSMGPPRHRREAPTPALLPAPT